MRGISGKALRRSAIAIAALAVVATACLFVLDRAFPPPLPQQPVVSAEVLDRDGQLLRAFATPDGYWRFGTTLERIDPAFLDMLVAYEDKRFWEHSGVDLLHAACAADRAAHQPQHCRQAAPDRPRGPDRAPPEQA
jgi:penicillin-binding protein 1C